MTTAASLILTVIAGHASATLPPPQARPPFYEDIQAFARADRQSPPPKGQILFVGSSSFRMWDTMQKDFPAHPLINRGFGGSTLPDVIRYANQIIFPYQPKQIVIYCGENDLASDDRPSSYQVARRFAKLHRLIRRKLPVTSILFVSLKPSPSRIALLHKMKDVNLRVQRMLQRDAHAQFVDVYWKMVDANGRPRPELFREDKLHMTPSGYAIWVRALEPVLVR